MKTKIISNTYLRDINKYQIKLYLDEDELIDAYESGDVSKEDYELVYKMRDRLLNEINNKTNKVMNMDYMKYLNDFE